MHRSCIAPGRSNCLRLTPHLNAAAAAAASKAGLQAPSGCTQHQHLAVADLGCQHIQVLKCTALREQGSVCIHWQRLWHLRQEVQRGGQLRGGKGQGAATTSAAGSRQAAAGGGSGGKAGKLRASSASDRSPGRHTPPPPRSAAASPRPWPCPVRAPARLP